jgi:hypothetical protein
LNWSQALALAVAFNQVHEAFRAPFAETPIPPSYDVESVEGCQIYVTSTPSNDAFRAQVEEIARRMGCQPQPQPQPWAYLADATPIPPPPTPLPHSYVIVGAAMGHEHGPVPSGKPLSSAVVSWKRQNAASQSADILIEALKSLGLDTRRRFGGDNMETIDIELGNHSPWKP